MCCLLPTLGPPLITNVAGHLLATSSTMPLHKGQEFVVSIQGRWSAILCLCVLIVSFTVGGIVSTDSDLKAMHASGQV